MLKNVRANVLTLTLTWTGLSSLDGADLLSTLNPSADKPYLNIQYKDPATSKLKNGTFFADARAVTKYANGTYKEITVALTEV